MNSGRRWSARYVRALLLALVLASVGGSIAAQGGGSTGIPTSAVRKPVAPPVNSQLKAP